MSATLRLSLISHTNAGKTTLARTLLGRDVGEVRDAAHVTSDATAYTMLETLEGDRFELWDTPGFGDSARLARRLAQQGNPIGWFLAEVWDRLRDRTTWLAQQAVRNVRDRADVVLYLVNAAERPAEAGYLAPELAVLEWIGKPVIVLLNQTGEPRPPAIEAEEARTWREALAPHGFVASTLALDAFARCWVQERALFAAVTRVLPPDRRAPAERLARTWQARREAQFAEAMTVLARQIAQVAADREPVPVEPERNRWRELRRAIVREQDRAHGAAIEALTVRAAEATRASTEALIALHGLEGHAAREVLRRTAGDVQAIAPVGEGRAAMLGGVVSGALSGLAADLATGGLSLGAGMIAGGVLGALGGAGLARGFNLVRGTNATVVRWSEPCLAGFVEDALLRYLAVAHFGRGRGAWQQSEHPGFWRDIVRAARLAQGEAFQRAWAARESGDTDALVASLANALSATTVAVLEHLYPGSAPLGPESGSASRAT